MSRREDLITPNFLKIGLKFYRVISINSLVSALHALMIFETIAILPFSKCNSMMALTR